MKIGIDARFYGEAGPGRYVKNILYGLENTDDSNKYYVFLRKNGMDLYIPKNPNFIKVLADYKWYTWNEQLGFLVKLLSYKLDLLYVPHFNIPILYPKKIITAIPDLIMHTYSTERGTTLPKPYFKFKKFIYKLVVDIAVYRSSKIIVPSNEVKNDFIKVFPSISHNKYVVAYEGLDNVFNQNTQNNGDKQKLFSEFNISSPYILYISSMYEHKNVPNLIKAYKYLKDKYKVNYHLVIIGKKDKFSGSIHTLIANEKLDNFIHMPGEQRKITDEESITFRKNALLYVFPSLKEGFSLTPMEAQVFGLPCAISNIPVHKEVYGDSVAYFDPNNYEDIAKVIDYTINNEAYNKELVNKGYELIKKYDWIKTAQITMEEFNENYSG